MPEISGPHHTGDTDLTPEHTSAEIAELTSLSLKDRLFDNYMKNALVADFFTELEEEIDDEDKVEEMKQELIKYSDEDIFAALSLPFELRKRRFEIFNKLIKNGSSPTEIIKNLVEEAKKNGFGIGYHTSPYDIKTDKNGHWNIRGTESDHRDGDLNKAYYSSQYRHLYKKKPPQFIYIVRTDPTHRSDGNWHRASSLSIITRVSFNDVIHYVETTAEDIEKSGAGTKDLPH